MLKRVSIQNFKSLKDVTLDLQKVNLLIGPNNSGKTNFLKALEFTQVSYDHIRANAKRVKFYRANPTEILIRLEFPNNGMDYSGEQILYEVLEINSKGNDDFKEHYYMIKDNQKRFDPLGYFEEKNKSLIGNIIIYKPDPNTFVKPSVIGISTELMSSDASNIVSFLDRMLSNKYRKSVFNRIELDLQKCIPEFDELNLDDFKPTLEMINQFGDKSFKKLGLTNSKQDITYWADELSEGTLYFLALLCIINQPNPPKLLLLEEPEKGIHPRRIREVMDFIFRLAEEKDIQIILTTHNEHVLDDFATRPEAVFIFDKDDEGATYVRNLQTDIIEPTNQRNAELGLDPIDLTTNLSDNWLYGLLGGVPPIL